MEIIAEGLGKRYNFQWIFSEIQWHIEQGSKWVILGANGSGKSTLLQIIAGAHHASAGDITWKAQGQLIDAEQVYQYVSLAAPYLELIEDFTLKEHLAFHFSLKQTQLSLADLVHLSSLSHAADRPIRYYSSGMKQRVRLLLAICSKAPLLLLDEPTSNLDEAGIQWYQNLVHEFATDKTIVVASNHQSREYAFCNKQLSLVAAS